MPQFTLHIYTFFLLIFLFLLLFLLVFFISPSPSYFFFFLLLSLSKLSLPSSSFFPCASGVEATENNSHPLLSVSNIFISFSLFSRLFPYFIIVSSHVLQVVVSSFQNFSRYVFLWYSINMSISFQLDYFSAFNKSCNSGFSLIFLNAFHCQFLFRLLSALCTVREKQINRWFCILLSWS